MNPVRLLAVLAVLLVAAPAAYIVPAADAHPPLPWHDEENEDDPASDDEGTHTNETGADDASAENGTAATDNGTAATGNDTAAAPSRTEDPETTTWNGHLIEVVDRFEIEGEFACGLSFWVVRTIDKCSDQTRWEIPMRPDLLAMRVTLHVGDAWIGDAGVCAIPNMPHFKRVCGDDGTMDYAFEVDEETAGLWTNETMIPVVIKLDDDELLSMDQPFAVTFELLYGCQDPDCAA